MLCDESREPTGANDKVGTASGRDWPCQKPRAQDNNNELVGAIHTATRTTTTEEYGSFGAIGVSVGF